MGRGPGASFPLEVRDRVLRRLIFYLGFRFVNGALIVACFAVTYGFAFPPPSPLSAVAYDAAQGIAVVADVAIEAQQQKHIRQTCTDGYR